MNGATDETRTTASSSSGRQATVSGDPIPISEAAVRLSISGKHVCPYCGQLRPPNNDPCPHCTMEDSPATRQATKARIGPWYVLQTRNPAAPGMKYTTLLALIHRGHVTPRSVVRGPTTHQLWRFAAHVRGVSREFGLCYSCGGAIENSASLCPRCQRSQDPPPDPDTLLAAAAARSAPASPGPPAAMIIDGPSHVERMRELNRARAESRLSQQQPNPQQAVAAGYEPDLAIVNRYEQLPSLRTTDGRIV